MANRRTARVFRRASRREGADGIHRARPAALRVSAFRLRSESKLQIEEPEKEFGDEEVDDQDDDGGFDEGGDGGAADAFGAAFDAEALMATD